MSYKPRREWSRITTVARRTLGSSTDQLRCSNGGTMLQTPIGETTDERGHGAGAGTPLDFSLSVPPSIQVRSFAGFLVCIERAFRRSRELHQLKFTFQQLPFDESYRSYKSFCRIISPLIFSRPQTSQLQFPSAILIRYMYACKTRAWVIPTLYFLFFRLPITSERWWTNSTRHGLTDILYSFLSN